MILLAACAVLVATASWAASGAITKWLRSRTILDHPVARSSHRSPVPKGAGAAVVAVVLCGWLGFAIAGRAPAETPLVCALALALAALSWFDDLRDLSPALRLALHFLIVGIAVAYLPARGRIFAGLLPPALDMVLTALAWTWFINLFNFMDGIDGITAVETSVIGGGLLALAAVIGVGTDGLPAVATVLTAAAIGFLPWNWQPARVFLGDVGSVPLGFLTGWLLLLLVGNGQAVPALLLPLYYICDASITLAFRLARGERVWHPHRNHFYQRALGTDQNHAAVVAQILLADFGLLGAALLGVWQPLPALVLGAVIVAFLLRRLDRRGRRQPVQS